jgi:hypothetical protein
MKSICGNHRDEKRMRTCFFRGFRKIFRALNLAALIRD